MQSISGQLAFDLGEARRTKTGIIVLGIAGAIAIGAGLAWAPFKMSFIIIGVIFWLLPFISIELGLYGMVVLLPLPEARLRIGEVFTISFSSLVMVSILLTLISRRVIRREPILGFNAAKLWPLWFFALAHFASIGVSVSLTRSLGIFIHLLIWILLLLVTSQVITDRRILRNVLLIMVLEGLVITFVGYYNNYVDRIQVSALYHYTGGVASIYSNRNQYGHYLISVLPLAAAFTLYDRSGPVRLFGLGSVFSLSLSLITTFSRGAWVAAFMGLSVFMRNWKAWVLALVAVMAIYYWTPDNIKTRFRSIWDPRVSSANQSRLLIHASGAILWLQNPILGVGTGNFEIAVGSTRISSLLPTNLSAHDTYLEMAAETGIVGLIALLTFFYFVYRNISGIRIPPARGPDRIFKLGLLSVWISILVHYIVITAFFNSMPWFIIGVILAANRILDESDTDATGAVVTPHS
jgi:putative inorganic carbon (HCO3(-)) transporter